jgi:large subunit ribosomal protein L29
MPLPKIAEFRELTDVELDTAIADAKKDLFQLRFQKGTRRMDKPHQFKHLKHKLAQLMTLERDRVLKKVED